KRRFGLVRAVEKQWIVGKSGDGPVVFPGITIRHTPERDPVDGVLMPKVNVEELSVTTRKELLDGIGEAVGGEVQALRHCSRPHDVGGLLGSGPGEHVDIQLGDVDFDADLGKSLDCGLLQVDARPLEVEVPLRSDGSDRDALVKEALY